MPANTDVASGRYACAKLSDDSTLYEITGWTMQDSEDDVNYVSCETDGARKRVDGNTDTQGTLSGVFNTENPITDQIDKGDLVVLHLFARKPTASYTGLYHKVPAKILSVDETADVEGAAPHRWTANWVLHTTTADPALLKNQTVPALT